MDLRLEKRGMNFRQDGSEISDVGNYRVFCYLKAKNGDLLCGDFGGWVRKDYTKRKKGVVVNPNALAADLQYCKPDETGFPCTYGWNPEKHVNVDISGYSYTRADILRFCSDITGLDYDRIVFADSVEEDGREYRTYEKAVTAAWKKRREEEEEQRRLERERLLAWLRTKRMEKAASGI